MAHLEKYSRDAAAPMLEHYDRVAERERGYVRDNIDNSRTRLNYNLCERDPRKMVSDALERTRAASGRRPRSDVNVICDWVITKPDDVREEDTRRFFESVADFLRNRYGAGNLAGAYVHMDEATPHMHAPIIPMVDGRLCAKQMFDRADLRTFHDDLNEALDDALGYHVSVLLDESQTARKTLSRLGQKDYIAAERELERKQDEIVATNEKLEEARGQVAEQRAAYDDLVKKARGSRRRLSDSTEKLERSESELAELTGCSSERGGSLEASAESYLDSLEYIPRVLPELRRKGTATCRREQLLRSISSEMENSKTRGDGAKALRELTSASERLLAKLDRTS